MQNITDFLNESIQINEDRIAHNASVRITKFLQKETLDMSKKGFGGFGKDGKAMFVEFFRAVVFEAFQDVNYPELSKENEKLGKKHLTKIDEKHRRYMDNRILKSEFIYDVVRKITEICKWDATTLSLSMSIFFENQGFRDMEVSDGQEVEEVKKKTTNNKKK